MSDALKRNSKYFVKVESVEGAYEAPAGSDAIQVLADGAEMIPVREIIDRKAMNGSLGMNAGRPGQRSVSGSLPVEFKAGVAGAEPEYGPLMQATLGGKRQQAADLTASDADGGVHSSSRLCLANADKNKVRVGDVVHIARSGANIDHVAVVTAVGAADGAVHIVVSPAASAPFEDGDVIKAFTTYHTASAGHPSLSILKEVEGGVLEKAVGCKVASMSLNNWSAGQLADWAFGFEGLSYAREVAPSGLTPVYDAGTPPLVLNACVMIDGQLKHVSEMTLAVENTLAFKTSTASPNGRIAARMISRLVSGSLNPYKQSDDISFFEKFDENTSFSLLLYAYNPLPDSEGKRFKEVIGIYLPDCRVTELAEADKDGLLQDAVTFRATRGDDGSKEEMYCTMS